MKLVFLFIIIPNILMSKECIHFLGHPVYFTEPTFMKSFNKKWNFSKISSTGYYLSWMKNGKTMAEILCIRFKKCGFYCIYIVRTRIFISDILWLFTVPDSPQISQHVCEIRVETHFSHNVQCDSQWTVFNGIRAYFATFCLHFTKTGWVVSSLRRGHRRTPSV